MLQIEDTLSSKSTTSNPLTIEAQESASEALSVLAKLEGDEDDTAELANILTKPWLEHLLSAHDKIGALKTINQHDEENTILDRIGAYRDTYSEPNIQVVVIGTYLNFLFVKSDLFFWWASYYSNIHS